MRLMHVRIESRNVEKYLELASECLDFSIPGTTEYVQFNSN